MFEFESWDGTGSTFLSICVVFFCPVARDGSPPLQCALATWVQLDVAKLSQEFNGLDVAEVKHPSEL
jgi:hypothetical protein